MDALATNGTRFTNYYTHASCSPTRSMLLSGQDTHLNGLGAMDEWTAPNQMGKEGYEGHLSTSRGKATIDTLSGSSLNNPDVGGTLGYQINPNIQMKLSYSSTINDNNPEDLKMDGFCINII